MLNTIRGKITTGIILISFIILIIINFTIWKIFEGNLQTSILNDMKRIMSIIHHDIQRQTLNTTGHINLYNRNNLWTIMNTINLQYDIYLSIKYDKDNYIQFAGEIIDKNSIQEIIESSTKKSSLLYIHNEDTRYFVTYSYPLYIKNEYAGIFVFQKDYLVQYANYKDLMTRILGIQIILFTVMILTNFIWLKKSTNSLNTLLKGIRSIGEGEFSNRLEARSNDEVAILIHHFNKMQDKIVSQMEYLQQEKTKIEKLEKSSRDFFNYATHEMKTPITSITGYAQLLKEGKIDEIIKDRAYERIITESDRMNKMVQNMLIIAKGKEIEKEHNGYFNLNELLVQITKEYELILNRGKIDLNLQNESILIFASEEEIRAVILNLFDNAIKYSTDGHIKIRSYLGNHAYISIENNTLPIPEGIRNILFDPFVKYNHGDQKQASSGLGLYICRELIENNKGKINYNLNGDIINFTIALPKLTN
ncbi:HAMP domain-containing sensor histidine kinase [Tissierella sp.]|uniref:HAMP domain-containing sensor histidine kinase n=1 Tax=Tissierella sp. TaxID=41274 RepID=UPI00285945B1|nr:HAMP domain-containing sensor histidine kinase [Tissierella sp.]MDR7857736.1 HAMP domain-containing sensor histidine kinase [Tissierella sp.]